MPLDPTIPLGVRPPQIESPMNALARAMQIQGLQQQNQLGQMQMEEMRRGIEDQNAMRTALSAPDADPYKVLLGRGKVKEATDYLKGKADVGKTEAETRAKQIETVKKQVDLAGQAFGYVRANPTVENAMAVLDSLERQGIYQPDQVAQMRQMVQQNPQNVAGLADQAFRMALDAKEQLAKFQTNNIGGQTITQGIDPVTGKATLVSAVQNTQSPDAILQAQTSEANNRRSVGAQYDLNKATREAAATQAQAVRDAAGIKDRREAEMKLADDYRTESKGWAETSTAMKKVMAAIDTADKNPGSALSAGTGFMKLLDPNSVVRETELGMALNASGWFDRALNVANTLQHGRIMTAEQKKNLSAAAQTLFEEAKRAQIEVDASYRKRAQDYKLDPSRVIVDRGQNAPRDTRNGPREVSGKVTEGPSLFDQADAILRGGK